VKILLVLAIVADLAVAALLVGISGFIFGGGPEGMNGPALPVIGWSLAFASCFIFPLLGGLVLRRGRRELGALVAWVPVIVALFFAFAS
jgi:hypothetical protein